MDCENNRDGAIFCKSDISRICACSSVSPVTAVTAKGTSKIVSLRFVAVTTISSSEVCANAGVMSDAVRAVVTAKMERRVAIKYSPYLCL